MTQRIGLLPPGTYLRFAGTVAEGNQASTHAALLKVGKQIRRYYIKCYGDAVKPLFNEIAGFLLAAEVGLPQAESAVLMALPGELLDKHHPGKGFNSQAHWLCWCTTAIMGGNGFRLPTAHTYFNDNLLAAADDLRAWKALPGLLAFDEWVANVDRNTGNLIRLSAGDYAIIDHGAILTGPDWAGDMLAPVASYTNKIWLLLCHCRGFTLPVSSGAMHACTTFTDAYLTASPEMRAFGSELLNSDDLSSCDIFLRERSINVKRYLQRRLGVLI